ncbi:hypothetical protein N5079_13125 [Planotetraspora sp. A-T 1434]|uniref:hypothetical protein n=1 Tax=Planotetraspora sp. A-T 1434 TaxID=2979219 RepID=UPI0021C07335|nr:hypothetical protein [Planotetraspora sp. A-T 1434]MCT9931160.1 hypothetical protein [Planotetraspora sp. A-T 1434]
MELAALGVGSVVLAVIMTWPTMAHPATTLPGDLEDPPCLAWEIAWYGHALLQQFRHPFDGNIFWPVQHTAVISDSLVGLAPLGLGVNDMADALLRYNLIYVLAAAFNFVGAYLLARQLGSGRTGALVAGAAFAYTPWRICHAIHINILMTGGVPLSIALLLRGHGIGRGRWDLSQARPWPALAGWAVAAWQMSLGFAIGLSFAYVLMLIVLAGFAGWLAAGRPRPSRRLLAADVAGGVGFAAVTFALGSVFAQVAKDHPEAARTRNVAILDYFSPPLRGFWAAHENSFLWGPLTSGARDGIPWTVEACLFPGLTVVLIAALGLVVTVWSRRRRVWLVLVVLISALWALGTTFLGGRWTWLPARELLPGFDAVRTSGRLVMYAVLALGLLAAGAVTRLTRLTRFTRFTRVASLRSALLAIPLLVCVEGLSTVPHPKVPQPPSALAQVKGPVLILPALRFRDPISVIWSTNGFYQQVNGHGSFIPRMMVDVARITTSFPDRMSLEYLRRMGVREVVIPRDRAIGHIFETAVERSVTGLPVERRDMGDSVLYVIH